MEEADKGWLMIRIGVSGLVFFSYWLTWVFLDKGLKNGCYRCCCCYKIWYKYWLLQCLRNYITTCICTCISYIALVIHMVLFWQTQLSQLMTLVNENFTCLCICVLMCISYYNHS